MSKVPRSARRFPALERIRTSLWFVPGLAVAVSVFLAIGVIALDRTMPQNRTAWFLFEGGPESARSVLSTIAAAMVTSISLIFSVTMVVLQLASAQYSPRVLRTFIRDRLVQAVLGVYIATFVYSLLVLSSVRAGDAEGEAFVPAAGVSGALALSLASLALFVRYIDHIAHAIRAVTLLEAVAEETRAALDGMYPDDIGDSGDDDAVNFDQSPDHVITSDDGPGVVVAVNEDGLLASAAEADVVVALKPLIGEFVPHGGVLFHVYGHMADDLRTNLVRAVGIAKERTMRQDPAFGFRQIVDIAERALSPGVNDPTTATQAVDQLHDLLRRLARRRFPSPVRIDNAGAVRVLAPRYDWDDYVELAFDEIRHYGRESVQVAKRLRGALEELDAVVPENRRPAIQRQLALLDASVRRNFEDEEDRQAARGGALIS